MTINALVGSRRQAVYTHATPFLRLLLATIVLSLALVGLVAKAFIPGFIDDDLTCQTAADPGSATTDNSDDDGKPDPQSDGTTSKIVRAHIHFAKAFLLTVDLALLHSLMPIEFVVVSNATTEPSLSDHFLPNAETGPPSAIVPWPFLPIRCLRSPVSFPASSPPQFILDPDCPRSYARASIPSATTNPM